MGKLKLPTAEPPKKAKPDVPVVQNEALSPEDVIEYGLTVEVPLEGNRKAWVKFGTTSSIREGETTERARARVTEYVNAEIDNRIEALG